MRTGGYCGDFMGEVRAEEAELLGGATEGPRVLAFKGGRFGLGYPFGMPLGVDRTVSFQVYVDGEFVEGTGKPVAVLKLEAGVQQHVEVIGIATRLRQKDEGNVLSHAGGRRVRLRWEASSSEDAARYRIYGNGGAGAVDYGTAVDEVEAAPGGVKSAEVKWTSGQLADGTWRFGVRAEDGAGNEAVSPARETEEIEVKGLPLPVTEVTFDYDGGAGRLELRWAGSGSFN